MKCSNRDKYWRKDNLYNRSTNTINQGKKFRKRLTLSGEFKVGIFSHNFSELKKMTTIPVYDIITPTINYLNHNNYKSLAIFATNRTIDSHIFKDKLIAKDLGKSFYAVKAKRQKLGLFRQDKNSNSYPTLSKYLRGHNQKWKLDSMKASDYKCVLTGSKQFEIHHLYGVSNMISDILNKYGLSSFKPVALDSIRKEELPFSSVITWADIPMLALLIRRDNRS